MDLEQGLVHSGTGSREVIIQDREGFIWFSTHHGISRFDGTNFKNFLYEPGNSNSLGGNNTVGIVEADDGTIWVGTADMGLYFFDPQTEQFVRAVGNGADSLGHGINTLNKDRDGNIWIGTRFDGFHKWDKKTRKFEQVGDLLDGHDFFQQENGTIWLGSQKGLHKYLPDGTTRLYPIPLSLAPDNWRYRMVHAMVELPNGKFLLTSTWEGFWEFDPNTGEYRDLRQEFRFKNSKVPSAFYTDEKGMIWISAVGELWRWNPYTRQKTKHFSQENNIYSIPPSEIPCLFRDNTGGFWMISRSDGMAVTHNLYDAIEHLPDPTVHGMLALENARVLFWTSEGFFLYNSKNQTRTPVPIPATLRPGERYGISLFSKNEVLIYEGLKTRPKLYNLQTGDTQILPQAYYYSSVAGGRIWDGLHYYDRKSNSWKNAFPEFRQNIPDFVKSTNFIVKIAHDTLNRIWITTTRGLYNYDLKSHKYKYYSHNPEDPHSLPSEVCQPNYPGSGRRMYLPTTNGLSIYDPAEDHFQNFSEKNGLLHDVINLIVEDPDGNPWIVTALGIQKLDLESKTFTNFNGIDGFPTEYNSMLFGVCDDNGFLYFHSENGPFRFHPDSLPKRNASGPMHLLDFYINHQLISPSSEKSPIEKQIRFLKSIQLAYSQNDFGFSFVMPHFYKPEESQYFYRLPPYQKDWISIGQENEIHFTNIDPGSYTFEVKAQTGRGVWSSTIASIKIRVLPPWYKTWWARTLFVLFLAGLIYAYYRYNLSRALEKAESKRLRDLDSLKTRLYTNITHEFRTPLTIIMGMIDNIRGYESERTMIKRNSKNLLRLINQLLDLSKLDSGTMKMDLVQGDIIHYLRYLTESFYSMAQEKNLKLEFSTEVPNLVMDFDEVKVQHVVYNLLSNAIKFTESGGTVAFQTDRREEDGKPLLQLQVKDSGIGIAPEQLEHIFDRFYQADSSQTRKGEGTGIGLALTKELIEMMGGSISVQSVPGQGTEFTILLPVTSSKDTPGQEEKLARRKSSKESVPIIPAEPDSNVEKQVKSEKPQLLLIEDNKDVVSYIKSILKLDYEVQSAPDGKAGVDMALSIVPDIIISDVMMPEMDGYEVCETLKSDERTSHIPIILLTAKAADSDRIAGLKKGADAYLMKPFNKEELLVRLEKLLELRKALLKKYANWQLAPETPEEPTLEDAFLVKLREAVLENMDDPDFDVPRLCQLAHLSNMQVNRKLKALTGQTPSRFIRSVRLHKAKELLETTDQNISEIAYDVGFNDPNYFSRSFSEEFGNPPNYYRK